MEELQLRLREKQLTTKVFYFGAKRPFFSHKKWQHHKKKVIALNMYIGTNILVYERWLGLKVWYMAAQPAGPNVLAIPDSQMLMHASQKYCSVTECRVLQNGTFTQKK